MTCPTTEELAAYQLQTLSARVHTRVEEHLAACSYCRQELGALTRTTTVLAAAPAPLMPADLWPGVAARLQARHRHAWWWRLAAGAGMAALLAGGLMFARQAEPPLAPAPTMANAYVADHQFLAAQELTTDRASLGVVLASQRE